MGMKTAGQLEPEDVSRRQHNIATPAPPTMEVYADAVAAAHRSDRERAWRTRDLKRLSRQREGQVITLKEEVDYDDALAAAAKRVSHEATEFATTEIQYNFYTSEDLGTVHANTRSVQVKTLPVSLHNLRTCIYHTNPQPILAAIVLTHDVDSGMGCED
jgi:hypothetical protein